jgi:hypothetical protein
MVAGMTVVKNELGIRGTQMGPFFVWALINDHFWIFFYLCSKQKKYLTELLGMSSLMKP